MAEKEVFELIEANEELVALKVKAEDNLTIALNPYISGDMDYITVTRGKDHILTIIYKDGKTSSFSWGQSGYTLISDSSAMLKTKVIDFIENKEGILIGLKNQDIKEASVFFNNNLDKWQLTAKDSIGSTATKFSEKAKNEKDMFEEIAYLIKGLKTWEKNEVRSWRSGFPIWEAIIN